MMACFPCCRISANIRVCTEHKESYVVFVYAKILALKPR